jgi:hypothetical protein
MYLYSTVTLRFAVIAAVISCISFGMFFFMEVRAQPSLIEEPTELGIEPLSNTTSTPLIEPLSNTTSTPLNEDSAAIIEARPTTIKIISTCELRNGTCGLLLDNLFAVKVFAITEGKKELVRQFPPSGLGRTILFYGPEFSSVPIQYQIRQIQSEFYDEHMFNDVTEYSSECIGEENPGQNKECRIHTKLSIRQ